MGQTDIERQELNVFKIKTLGAEVIPVPLARQHSKMLSMNQ